MGAEFWRFAQLRPLIGPWSTLCRPIGCVMSSLPAPAGRRHAAPQGLAINDNACGSCKSRRNLGRSAYSRATRVSEADRGKDI